MQQDLDGLAVSFLRGLRSGSCREDELVTWQAFKDLEEESEAHPGFGAASIDWEDPGPGPMEVAKANPNAQHGVARIASSVLMGVVRGSVATKYGRNELFWDRSPRADPPDPHHGNILFRILPTKQLWKAFAFLLATNADIVHDPYKSRR